MLPIVKFCDPSYTRAAPWSNDNNVTPIQFPPKTSPKVFVEISPAALPLLTLVTGVLIPLFVLKVPAYVTIESARAVKDNCLL